MHLRHIHITPEGAVRYIDHDDIRFTDDVLGCGVKRRVSHVWPQGFLKRQAFRFLRWAFGERGRVAEWTRGWTGPFQVRWAATPWRVEHVAPSRRSALHWETTTLEAKLMEGSYQ